MRFSEWRWLPLAKCRNGGGYYDSSWSCDGDFGDGCSGLYAHPDKTVKAFCRISRSGAEFGISDNTKGSVRRKNEELSHPCPLGATYEALPREIT